MDAGRERVRSVGAVGIVSHIMHFGHVGFADGNGVRIITVRMNTSADMIHQECYTKELV